MPSSSAVKVPQVLKPALPKPAPALKKKKHMRIKLPVHGGMHWIICKAPHCSHKGKPVRVSVSLTRTCRECFSRGGISDIFLQSIDMGNLRGFIRDECPENWDNSSVFGQ